MGALYKKLAKPETIWRAWSVVHENGRTSKSARTRAEIESFSAEAPRQIQRIAWQLQRQKYRFEPAHGVAMQKKNKKAKRPVVMAPIPNRIVQRALLDVIQSIPAIKEKLLRGRNFGGIEGVGVPKAVEEAYIAARSSGYFIRTDIKAFFDNVPREKAIAKIAWLHLFDVLFGWSDNPGESWARAFEFAAEHLSTLTGSHPRAATRPRLRRLQTTCRFGAEPKGN